MVRSNVAKAGIGYTVANILIKGISFLTLPIFSRVLDTYDFGIYNVFIAYDAILAVVIGFALHASIKSANWQFPGKIDEYVSSLSLVYMVNMAVLIIVALLFGPVISEIAGLDTVVIVCLIIHSMGAALVTLYNYRISLQYSYKKYMAVAATSSLGNVALSLVLVFTVFYGQRYLGRILGATIVFALVGGFILFYFWRRCRPKVKLEFWSYGIKYSTPLVFHGLSQVVLAQVGRLMVNYMVSTIAAGIYGLAANIQIILATLTDSVSTVWSTWFYETMEGESAAKATHSKCLTKEQLESRRKNIQARADQLIVLFALLAVCLLAIVPEMIWVLGGDAYIEGAYCAFGMILSGYCVFVYNIIVVGEYYKQKTKYIMWATVVVAIINVVFNYIGITVFGYIAAAYATMAAYVVYVAIHWFISSKLMSFSIVSLRAICKVIVVLILSTLVGFVSFDSLLFRLVSNAVLCIFLAFPVARQLGGLSGIKSLLGR